MKKILFSISFFLLCQHFIKAQQQVLTAVELIPQTSITVTSPGATTEVYPGSLITCNWTCNSDIRFGSLVNVLLVTQAQRSDLLAKMSRMGNLVPLDSISRVFVIKSRTDAYGVCYWDVPTTLAQGNYAVVVSAGGGKLGVGPVFTVNSIPSIPNILNYYPTEKGTVFGGTITFTGRDIKPEAVQVFIGTNPLEILSATEGQVVAKISGTQSGPLKIGHGQPSNTVTLENNFRPIGQPIITGVQPDNITIGTEVTVTGTSLDFVEFKKHTLQKIDSLTTLDFRNITPSNSFSSENTLFDYILLEPGADMPFTNVVVANRQAFKKEWKDGNSDNSSFKGTNAERLKKIRSYKTLGPKLIGIEKSSYRINGDGTKITFIVNDAFQAVDSINAKYQYGNNVEDGYFFHFYPSSRKDKCTWKLKFVTVDGLQQVISPNLHLKWAPLPPTLEPPIPPLHFIKIEGQSDSTNFVLVKPGLYPSTINIIGKGFKGAVVKLNKTVLASYLLGETVDGVSRTTDKDGNQKLQVAIPYSANSGHIEISNGGRTIRIPQKIIIVPEPRITSISHTNSVPVNTDITIRGFDFVAPAEAKGISFFWNVPSHLINGFTYKVVSSDQNTHVFRIEMAPGTPVVRNIPGVGNVSVFGGGANSLKFQLQLRQSNQSESIKYYDFFLTQ